MLTFIQNFWVILTKAPAIISIIRAIIDVVGSDQVQKILEVIRDALIKEAPPTKIPDIPETENQRQRIVDRLKRKLGLSWSGLNESELDAFLTFRDIKNTMASHENA
jgi:hypothetical protein